MLLKQRQELEALLGTAGKTEGQQALERMNELLEEQKFDDKETKLYLSELFTEDVVKRMSWLERLGWVLEGLHQDLLDVNDQVQLNRLKGTPAGEEIKALKDKKIGREKRLVEKQEKAIQAQVEGGVLPPGSLESFKGMRERSEEYDFKPAALEQETKFAKFSEKQLSDKEEFLEFRLYERGEELDELRVDVEAKQKVRAEEVLARTKPPEYPT